MRVHATVRVAVQAAFAGYRVRATFKATPCDLQSHLNLVLLFRELVLLGLPVPIHAGRGKSNDPNPSVPQQRRE